MNGMADCKLGKAVDASQKRRTTLIREEKERKKNEKVMIFHNHCKLKEIQVVFRKILL